MRCAVLVLIVVLAVVVDECCLDAHPTPVVGNSHRRPHGSLTGHHVVVRPPTPTPRPVRRAVRPIVRPAQCRNDAIFSDCFLCGKVAEANLIYRQCCERDAETVDFCGRLLS